MVLLPMRKRILQIVAAAVVLLVIIVVATGWWPIGRWRPACRSSTAKLQVAGLTGPVTIERDSRGIPTIRADKRDDVAFA